MTRIDRSRAVRWLLAALLGACGIPALGEQAPAASPNPQAEQKAAFEAAGGSGGLELLTEQEIERVARLVAERAIKFLGRRQEGMGRLQ